MSQHHEKIGELLRQAYLITPTQLEEALLEQSQNPQQRLGEILARKGLIKQETADFFAQKWLEILNDTDCPSRHPLGYYLREAGLLDEVQIQSIVDEQKKRSLWVRLGAMAVLKGWLAQSTVDFFLENLYPEESEDSPFIPVKDKKNKGKLKPVPKNRLPF
jgi:hypothetical protein